MNITLVDSLLAALSSVIYSAGPNGCILYLTFSFLALISIHSPRYCKAPFFILLVLSPLVLEMSEGIGCVQFLF